MKMGHITLARFIWGLLVTWSGTFHN